MTEEECSPDTESGANIRRTFSMMWSEGLGAAIKAWASSPDARPIPMELVAEDARVAVLAFEKGIDAYLEGFTASRGEWTVVQVGVRFAVKRLKLELAPSEVHIMVRRLLLLSEKEDADGNGSSLASAICEYLNIELI